MDLPSFRPLALRLTCLSYPNSKNRLGYNKQKILSDSRTGDDGIPLLTIKCIYLHQVWQTSE